MMDDPATSYKHITNYLLMKYDLLPIMEIDVDNDKSKKVYISALQEADKGDYSHLESLIEDALSQSIQESLA